MGAGPLAQDPEKYEYIELEGFWSCWVQGPGFQEEHRSWNWLYHLNHDHIVKIQDHNKANSTAHPDMFVMTAVIYTLVLLGFWFVQRKPPWV